MNIWTRENDYSKCTLESGEYFIVDHEDVAALEKYHWLVLDKRFYAHVHRVAVSLSRVIFPEYSGRVLKINKDYHDYRRCNLWRGNTFEMKGGYAEMRCYDGSIVKVDTDDVPILSSYVWHVDPNGYVIGRVDGVTTKMHRFLLRLDNGGAEEVDHINRDKLDNRRSNLRIATRSENCFNRGIQSTNTSGYIGVYKHVQMNKWCAQMNKDGHRMYLGYYDSIDDAVSARRAAELQYWGK